MDLDSIVREFLVESHENLDALDRALVALEQNPGDHEMLASIFRTIHTIKGTTGFLGFSQLEAITHVGENLLSRMRDGVLTLTPAITSGLLAMLDAIRAQLAAIEGTGVECEADYTTLIALLTELNAGTTAAPVAAVAPIAEPTPPPVAAPAAPVPASLPADSDQLAFAEVRSGEDRRSNDERRGGIADTSLRVDVGLLDKLMNLVGELVLARNQILQFTSTQADLTFTGATQRLNLVTSELQESVMKTRMQPIGNVWSKFPRIVRDLAQMCGKQVRIEMLGKETDLDKTIIEAIKDPLTHVVRNSVDHGIESPAVRIAAGKPAEGLITLRAFHEGGQINIEISDDGAGIDPARVRNKAVQRGLVTPDQAARMSDHEVVKLIFLPGFSTAETITNVSGRGVGMDVVKTNIEKIGGTVDIQSTHGAGTSLRIRIPLTLAIIPALMITTGGERFAIPQVNLLELVRLEGEQKRVGIEHIGDARFYRLRGDLLPIVDLSDELALAAQSEADVCNIAVLKADGRQFGLVVDAINDTEEIVVKPLGRQLKHVAIFAGATIMGDGCVALILDVSGIAQQAGVISTTGGQGLLAAETTGADAERAANLRTLLLFRVGEDARMAVPLALVARLEEFAAASIERSGEADVVQYRGAILPLINLSGYFAGTHARPTGSLQVIVFNGEAHSVGLVVDEILDIVTEAVEATTRAARHGVIGSAIVQQRVTELIDVQAIVADTDGRLGRPGRAA